MTLVNILNVSQKLYVVVPPNTPFQKSRRDFEVLLVPGMTLKNDIIFKKTLGASIYHMV